MIQRKTKVSCRSLSSKKQRDGDSIFESALTKHDRYLIELEKHKKLLKVLNKKDPKLEEKEKMEKGFNAYVNGANALTKPKPVFLRNNRLAKGKIAFPSPRITNSLPRNNNTSVSSNGGKTSRRRLWGQDSVDIVTDTGVKLHASSRNLNCNYSDDFDEDSIDFEKSFDFMKQNLPAGQERSKSVPLIHRKYWGQGSVVIKAASGEDLRASVSNITDYSMNFEEISDESSSETEVEIEEKLEGSLSSNDFDQYLNKNIESFKLN